MAAARQLRPRLRGVRHATLIGLLAVTGMRPGEAVGLDRHDVDLNTGVVQVRAGKQKKQREVPLHATARSARCADYVRLRDACSRSPQRRRSSSPPEADAWDARNSTAPSRSWSARSAWTAAALAPDPDLMTSDMRLPCTLCSDWYRAGENVDRRMPLLSTWLGHVDPASTYWYLEAVPELLELVSRRLEQLAEVVS